MPSITTADPTGPGFEGVHSIYQFTNSDGLNPGTVCGQAACLTLLSYCAPARFGLATLREIEAKYPPDIAGGALGTSPWQVRKILKHYGANELRTVGDFDQLKNWVGLLYPVICLIQNSPGLGLFSQGAHWFVVYAYDDNGVFVTNYGSARHLSWSDFKEKWEGLVPTIASPFFKGITNVSRALGDPLIPTTSGKRFA